MIQLELFPPSLSFKLVFKEAHLYPKSGNAGNGNSLSLLFLMVSGLGTHGGFGEGGKFFLWLFLGHPKSFSKA